MEAIPIVTQALVAGGGARASAEQSLGSCHDCLKEFPCLGRIAGAAGQRVEGQKQDQRVVGAAQAAIGGAEVEIFVVGVDVDLTEIAETLLRVLRIHDDAVKGFAIGITSHGTGTARAFQISPTAGAFSGLGMGLNGVLTSLCLPLIFTLWPV